MNTTAVLPEPANPMARLIQYLGKERGRFITASFYSILNKILDLMPPLMVGWIIDTVSGNTPSWLAGTFGIQDTWTAILFLCGVIIVVFAGESFFEWLYQLGFRRVSQDIQHRLRLDAYAHLQDREMAFFENNRTGNLLSILYNDISQMERFLSLTFNQILQLVCLFIFSMALLVPVSWQIALISLATIPPIVLGSLVYQRVIGPKYKRIQESVGEVTARLENNIGGIQVIKSFTAESYEYDRVNAASDEVRAANWDAIRLNSAYVPLIRIFIALGFALVMGISCWWYLQGWDNFTLGNLTLVAMLIQRLLWPITSLGNVFDDFERAKAGARRIFGLMDAPAEVSSSENAVQMERAQGNITFEGVDFHYDPQIPILKNIDFEIKKGETIGVAGPTGAGKTTLIKLLLRFYDPSSGRITLDGHDLRDYNLQDLRRQIGLVSQDTYLFHGTVAENIGYALPGATQAQIENAAKQAQLHDFVIGLPEGYRSLVGERGIKLSGGQRQRLSIARAILKNAPILILDEATSAVDSETEQAIQESLDAVVEGRTAIIIAHRLSTIRRADRIIVFEQGQITESGSHDALVAQGGAYANLWRVQVGERIGS